MKKRIFIILVAALVLCSISLFASCSCSCSCNKTYYSLTLNECADGEITATKESGSTNKDGKYLSGSVVKIDAIADEGYKLVTLKVNNEDVEGSSYQLTVTADTTVSAVFEKEYFAAAALDRIGAAFSNTYDLSGYDAADGIKGTVKTLMVMDGIEIPVTLSFSYAKDSADSFFGLDLKMELMEGVSLTALSMYYFDSNVEGEGRLYITILAIDEVLAMATTNPAGLILAIAMGNLPTHKYYVNTVTLTTIRDLLDREVPEDTSAPEIETASTIDLLEELGVIYGIENDESHTTLSFDVAGLLSNISEIFDSEAELPINADDVPPMNFTLTVEYATVSGVEKIKATNGISGSIAIVGGDTAVGQNLAFEFVVTEMTLQTWTGNAPTASFNKTGAVESTLPEILAEIMTIIGAIGGILG